jgi:sarcosine oxidase subunit delta
MLTLTCPHCGIPADETELAPGGEAHLKRHGPGSSEEEFEGYLFARANPKGVHYERWRHAFGCGKWFLAARDTATLRVWGTYPATLAAPADELRGLISTTGLGRGFEPGAPSPTPEAAQ